MVDELDARPLYSKLGATKATALLPSLLEKHRLVALNLEFCRAATILDAVAETQHATLKHINLNGAAGRGPSNSLKTTRKLQQIRSSGFVPARPAG